MERSGKRKTSTPQSLHFIPCAEIVFEYLEVEDILCRVSLVNSVFEEQAYDDDLWRIISKRKWSKWRDSGFGEKCGFCFMDGASYEEISLKEEELDFYLRHDIRALLEECAGMDFPYKFMVPETPIIYMNHILDWEKFEDYAFRIHGSTSTELLGQDIINKYDSFKDYLVIGSGFYETILLNTRTWEVLFVQLHRARCAFSLKEKLFRSGGSFCEWFDKGTSILDTNKKDKKKWRRWIKEKKDLDVIKESVCCTTMSENYPSLDKSDKDYAEDLADWRSYYIEFFSEIFKDEQVLCRLLRDVGGEAFDYPAQHFDLEDEINDFIH